MSADLETGESYEYQEAEEMYKLLEPRKIYDQAIVGLLESPDNEVVVYDAAMVVNLTAELYELTHDEALENTDRNIFQSKGAGFPVYVWMDVVEEVKSHDERLEL